MEKSEDGIFIKPAYRTQQFQEYYFSRKLQQLDEMCNNGADIVNLGIGSPDQPPPTNVIETLYHHALNPKNHGYQSYIGIPSLRKAFARKHQILLCNDNPYRFILNKDVLSLLALEGAKDMALELNSLSKSHNMAGWRIGMLAGKAEFIKTLIRVKSNMDSGMFQPLQAAVAAALDADECWYKSVNDLYGKRRHVAEKIMAALACTFDKKDS